MWKHKYLPFNVGKPKHKGKEVGSIYVRIGVPL